MGVYICAVRREKIMVEIQGKMEPVYIHKYLFKPSFSYPELNRPGHLAQARIEAAWAEDRPRFVVDIFEKVGNGDVVIARFQNAPISMGDDQMYSEGGKAIGHIKKIGRKWVLQPVDNIQAVLEETAKTSLTDARWRYYEEAKKRAAN